MSLTLTISVVPSSGRHAWAVDKSGRLKCFLKQPPENNKANVELIKSIASILGISHTQVQILLGATSRKKVIRCQTDLTFDDFIARLGLGLQQSLVK
jgi:uncharacterized protein YggU (UPF0235/DUF167 family)